MLISVFMSTFVLALTDLFCQHLAGHANQGSIAVEFLLPPRQIGDIAAAVSRCPTVVDYPVGQKRVLPRHLLDPDIPLAGLRTGSQQDPVDLMPPPGEEDRLSAGKLVPVGRLPE